MRHVAIVLAGGNGSRMGSDCPKQYLMLGDKPVLYYSLKVFDCCEAIDEIILVTRNIDLEYCKKEIVDYYRLSKVKHIIAGGNERYESVRNGLMLIEDEAYVLIHDGARPGISEEVVKRLIEDARQYGNAVAAVKAKDTVRITDEMGRVIDTPPRQNVWNMQTPQVFSAGILKKAYQNYDIDSSRPVITDDAMLAEYYADVKIHLTQGSYDNLKITTPQDLVCAYEICRKNN